MFKSSVFRHDNKQSVERTFHIYTNNALFLKTSVHHTSQNIIQCTSMHGPQTKIGCTNIISPLMKILVMSRKGNLLCSSHIRVFIIIVLKAMGKAPDRTCAWHLMYFLIYVIVCKGRIN